VANRIIKSLHKSGRISRSKARAVFKEIRSKLAKAKRPSSGSAHQRLNSTRSVLKFRAEKWFSDPEATVVIAKKR
jgi:hypothetical protein